MAPKKRVPLPVKLAVAAVVIAGLGYLFLHSLESTRSEPYTVDRAQRGPWTLVIEPADAPNAPLLSLRTGGELVTELFTQLFRRAMESMNSRRVSTIPVVLHSEFDRGLAGRMTPDELLGAARAAGLELADHGLRCLAHRRVSEPGNVRQVYFVLADSPSIVAFREQLAASASGAFQADAQTPIMFVAASDAAFHRWLPIRATEADCVAPIEVR